MAAKRRYKKDELNPRPGDRLTPERIHDVLTGIRFGLVSVPRPVAGFEHEYNSVSWLPASERRRSDEAAVPHLLAAVRALGGRPARSGLWAGGGQNPCDRDRMVLPGPGWLPVHFYNDLDKFEQAYGEFTSARGFLAFYEAMTPLLRRIIDTASADMSATYKRDPGLLVHLSGGDGSTSTCASLHLNIPWADVVAEAAYVSGEAADHLQETLVRQLAVVTSVAATGMPSETDGMLSDPRSRSFSHVAGDSTLEPQRALQYRRLEGRPREGYERDGCGRNMQMVATCGRSQVGNFLMVALSQLETLRLHLAVLGLHESPVLVEPGESLLATADDLAVNRPRSAALMRRALDDYVAMTAFLAGELGGDVMEQLVPDYRLALRLTDTLLTAIETGDAVTVMKMTDYGKKLFLAEQHLSTGSGGWAENLTGLLNICFAFASPQEASPYYTYFKENGLEAQVVDDEEIEGAGPDPLTRGFFMAEVARRFWDDPGLDDVTFDWDSLTLRRATPLSGGWIPEIRTHEATVLMPASVGHNAATLGDLFDTRLESLDDVFDLFGSRPSTVAAVGQ